MKYGLLDYPYTRNGFVNIGDHIQSLAAKQYLPSVDFYLDREKLNEKSPYGKVIMNGWYMHDTHNWPPHENITPLFVSFHLNPRAYSVLKDAKVIDYLKAHQPIGCRDYSTQEILDKHGIETYYSFCLTSTLGQTYSSNERDDSIIFNDVLHKYQPVGINKSYSSLGDRLKVTLKNIKDYPKVVKRNSLLNDYFPESVIGQSIPMQQDVEIAERETLFQQAEVVLRRYSKAKVVATSRIHCAIPCLALNTPVLFLLDGVDDPDRDLSRFNGILDHVNILTHKSEKEINQLFGRKMNIVHPEEIDWENPPANPKSHLQFANTLINTCKSFVE